MKEKLVQINGVRLFAKLYGKKKDKKPTIIMDAGYGDYSKAWNSIIVEISKLTDVLVYDRAGLGKSEKSPRPRTNLHMIKELNELIEKMNIKPPFIIDTPVGYQLKYQDAHYTFNDRDELIHIERFTVESKKIEKETFEKAIRNGFKEYRDFIVKNKLPISSNQLEQLLKQKI